MNEQPTDPFERTRLTRFIPNRHLVEHFSRLSIDNRRKRTLHPDAGCHNLAHFRMMSRVVSGAHASLCGEGTEECTALIFGAKECTDVPLETLVRTGFVYLVDVDLESLRIAVNRISDPSLRDRIGMVSMDVSLFENVLLDRAQVLLLDSTSDIDRAFQAVVTLNREAAGREPDLLAGKRLPIREGSVGLVVSSMTLSQFMIGYVQLLVKMFLVRYGREETRRYFLAGAGSPEGMDGSERIRELQHSTTDLARRVAEKHVREVGRIGKPDGRIVLADHALHGRGTLVSEHEVDVDVRSLMPYSKNPGEDRSLRFRENRERPLPTDLRVDRTRPDPRFVVEGADSLKQAIDGYGGMEILDEQSWWWVTERAKDEGTDPFAWNLSYVEAFTLTPT